MLLRPTVILSLLSLLLALPASAAAQGNVAPDGTPARLEPRGEKPTQTLSCASVFSTRIISQNAASTTTSTSFALLPGAAATFTIFQSACVRILFTAETGCSQTSAQDFCYVRALDNGIPMDPAGAGRQAIDSENSSAKGHAFQWMSFVGISKFSEEHEFTIEWKVGDRPTQFHIDDWTMTVQILSESGT